MIVLSKVAMVMCILEGVLMVVVKRNAQYSLSLFDRFCPVKRNGKYFAEKCSEQKVLIIKVVGLYSTYQKCGENWT